MGALSGLLVVAIEQAVAAPLATARLAAGGARVIKIERPEGDFAREYDHVVNGDSAYFVWLNRGKESLVCDIKQPDDAALIHRLLTRADIFVQNLAPGAAVRAGFGSEELRRRHPRLICCDISGYGSTGPSHAMKAYDLLIQCETGLASITGGVDEPGRVGVSIADIACGMNAHAAILEALLARERTGCGTTIEVSLFDSLANWMTVPLLHHEYGGKAPARVGLKHPSIAPYGAFTCGDGQAVVLAIQNEREWQRLCDKVLGQPELAADPRFVSNSARVTNRPEIDGIVAGVIGSVDRAEAVRRLDGAGVAFASVNSVADLSVHTQLRRTTANAPEGPVALPAWPAIGTDDNNADCDVPHLGQHNDRIRTEFSEATTG